MARRCRANDMCLFPLNSRHEAEARRKPGPSHAHNPSTRWPRRNHGNTTEYFGNPDHELIALCRSESRALVTLDLDFANPLQFWPSNYAGIAVLRLPSPCSYGHLSTAIMTLARALETESLERKLWIVELDRIRIYLPENE
jgi:predicted nuclease of predicted toxin-antitoxin system